MESDNSSMNSKATNKSLMIAFAVMIVAVLVIAIVGFMLLKPEKELFQGQADATTLRISGKLMGRVTDIYVKEGDKVCAGDTLAHIHSSLADAQLQQAMAVQQSAASQSRKVDKGARAQIIASARSLWEQAKTAEEITRKTYERMQNLYAQGVISEQKRDEAKAAHDAAVAATAAAKAQYDMALEGAQAEDKASAAAMAEAATGSVNQVQALLEDQYLIAPCDGEITDIYPEVSELVAPGAPIMTILRPDDMWIAFNLREELISNMGMGQQVKVRIPALADTVVEAKVFYIKDKGSYAVWSATKANGKYDSRTFEVKLRPLQKVNGLRPGMSVLLQED